MAALHIFTSAASRADALEGELANALSELAAARSAAEAASSRASSLADEAAGLQAQLEVSKQAHTEALHLAESEARGCGYR